MVPSFGLSLSDPYGPNFNLLDFVTMIITTDNLSMHLDMQDNHTKKRNCRARDEKTQAMDKA